MVNSRVGSRIVVAAGLAVVFGIGVVSIFVVPAKPVMQKEVAHNAPAAASSDQTVLNSPAPNAVAPDQTAPVADASAANAAPPPVAPPAVESPNDTKENSTSSPDTNVAKASNGGRHGARADIHHDKDSPIRLASADHGQKSSAPPADGQSNLETDSSDGGTPSASSPLAANDAVAPSDAAPPVSNAEANRASEQSAGDNASDADTDGDGRITAQVRSSIVSLVPGSNIDVKATSGNVALAGSVPSQSMVEDARQAAQQIAGVRQVDTSALTVTPQ